VPFNGKMNQGDRLEKITLGIDPGSFTTGFGIVTERGGQLKCLGYGTVDCAVKLGVSQRLLEIGEGIRSVIEDYRPSAVALEKVFIAKNADSALKLGQARGVILYECARAGIVVFEYNPTEVKASLVDNGRAAKEQVQFMVQAVLGLPQIEKLDASDALALAIHHTRIASTRDLMKSNEVGRST
jgi:crossover junction endodeoxyribonuclease RuvC